MDGCFTCGDRVISMRNNMARKFQNKMYNYFVKIKTVKKKSVDREG